jgi:hypothetical protein
VDRAILEAARYGYERARGEVAERGGEGDLLLSRDPPGRQVRRAEMTDQPLRQRFNRLQPIVLARVDDHRQRRPAEGADAEETGMKSSARLRAKLCRIETREGEGAGDGPLAGLGGLGEDERVRGVDPNGAQQLHLEGPSARPIRSRSPARFCKALSLRSL